MPKIPNKKRSYFNENTIFELLKIGNTLKKDNEQLIEELKFQADLARYGIDFDLVQIPKIEVALNQIRHASKNQVVNEKVSMIEQTLKDWNLGLYGKLHSHNMSASREKIELSPPTQMKEEMEKNPLAETSPMKIKRE